MSKHPTPWKVTRQPSTNDIHECVYIDDGARYSFTLPKWCALRIVRAVNAYESPVSKAERAVVRAANRLRARVLALLDERDEARAQVAALREALGDCCNELQVALPCECDDDMTASGHGRGCRYFAITQKLLALAAKKEAK